MSTDRPPIPNDLSRIPRFVFPLLILGLFALAIWALDRELTHFHWREMWDSIQETSSARMALAFLFMLGSYGAIIVYCTHSFRYADRPLPWRKSAAFSLIIASVSMNLGAAVVTSNLVRARLLSREGFTIGEMARSAAAHGVFAVLGQMLLAGAVLAWHAVTLPREVPLHLISTRLAGFLLFMVAVAGLAMLLARVQPIRFRNWQLPIPGRRLLLTGIGFGVLDWLFDSMVVVTLLPDAGVSTLQVLAIVLLAQVAAVISHVPGGLGVFEAVILGLMPESVSQSQLIGALLIYRAIYFLLPLLVALVLFARTEWRPRSDSAPGKARSLHPFFKHVRQFAPSLLAGLVFLSGVVLLVSGSTPGVPERLHWIRDALPLALVEVSHFLASIAGILLIVLAWSLRRRVNAAWWATVALLGLAMILSLMKGLDFEETIFLGLVLAGVISLRGQFHRQAGLFASRFSVDWWVAVLGVVTLTTWIGFLAYRHVDYQDQLWWKFTFAGDAPRFLRASAGIAVVLVGVGLAQLLRPSAGKDPRQPGMPDENVRAIIAASSDAEIGLAWLGDKRFMLSTDGRAALMYGTRGRSRIVMGDPFGPEDAWDDLLWRLLDECDRSGQRPVLYGISEENAHHYLDVGLQLFKIGEEARIPLDGFCLEGSKRKDLRNTVSKLDRQGVSFEILPPDDLEKVFPKLREISDAWLSGKNAQEKGFCLGSFQEDFLRHFPIAVLRQNGEIIAFANLLNSGTGQEEFTIDLMRFHPDNAPNGAMQYLFTQLMLWGREQGYHWFSLGVAPLSGLDNRSLAPLWHKIAGTIFRHAEHFYNFQGLRAYKEKFDPVWVSAYVAVPNAWDMPAAMLDSSALVSGGIVGMLKK